VSCGLSWSGETKVNDSGEESFAPRRSEATRRLSQPLEEFAYEKDGSWAFS